MDGASMKRDQATKHRPCSMWNYLPKGSRVFFKTCFKILTFRVFVSLGCGKRFDQREWRRKPLQHLYSNGHVARQWNFRECGFGHLWKRGKHGGYYPHGSPCGKDFLFPREYQQLHSLPSGFTGFAGEDTHLAWQQWPRSVLVLDAGSDRRSCHWREGAFCCQQVQ